MLKEKKITRKKQIEQKATELFQTRGYAATSMRDLASEMGLEAGSLYSHIKSKEEILRNICFDMANDLMAEFDKITTEQSSPSDKLKKYVVAHVNTLTTDTAAAGVFLHEWRHLSEPYLSDFLKMREEYEQRFREVVRQGMAQGAFKKVNEKFAVLTILASLNWVHQWYKPTGKMSAQDVADELAVIVLDGLRP